MSLTHAEASLIWANMNYDEPELEPADWTQWSPDSSLNYRFQNEVEALKLRHNWAAETSFSLDLFGQIEIQQPVNAETVEKIEKGGQRILNASHCRHRPGMERFLEAHDQLNAFVMFAACLQDRHPEYQLYSHPILGGRFERLFWEALDTLKDWKDPWEKPYVRTNPRPKRDSSPKRRTIEVQ